MSGLNLLPCPFCGGEAEIAESESSWCRCSGCGLETPFVDEHDEEEENSRDAATYWNTRANPLLPRVSPEDLVEGKWYVVKHKPGYNNGGITIAECDMETMSLRYQDGVEAVECEPFPVFWIVGGEHHFVAQFFESIWGPLPSFGLDDRDGQPTSQSFCDG